jgi:hypothetical protein
VLQEVAVVSMMNSFGEWWWVHARRTDGTPHRSALPILRDISRHV